MPVMIGMTDRWSRRVRVPLHPDTYGTNVYAAGYTIAHPVLLIMADTWETAWEVWCEQQRETELDADEQRALEAGEMLEGVEWADGVGYVATSDLVLDCIEGNDR